MYLQEHFDGGPSGLTQFAVGRHSTFAIPWVLAETGSQKIE
jgi:hypothetical protein